MIKRDINRIVVTGPTGAIGMAIIQECISNHIDVLVITHKESSRNNLIPKSDFVKVVYSDIASYDLLDVTGEQADAFVHLAWTNTVGKGRNDVDAQLKNVDHTVSAVRLAYRLGCKVFLGAGSQAEYGRVEGILNSKVPVFPENGYGIAKLCAGQMSRLLCSQLGLDHIWTRILSVYGPYDGENSMVISSIRKFLNDEKTIFTPGEQEWDYLYSKDAAKILLRLLSTGVDGKVYCIGSGIHRPLKEYIKEIYTACKNGNTDYSDIGIGKMPYSDKQVMMLCADTQELLDDIGTIEFTPFKEGIHKTIEFCTNNIKMVQ